MDRSICKSIKISKNEVKEVLKTCKKLLYRKLNEEIYLNIVDYLENHEKNVEFRVMNGFSTFDIFELALEIVSEEDTLYSFCHMELDTKDPLNPMYCFKLNFEHIDGDVLFKFKFKEKEDGEQVFIMSFHYPDPAKNDWVHKWIKKNLQEPIIKDCTN